MEKYFIQMNENYQKKYYPNGFLDGATRTTKSSGKVLVVLSIVLFVVFGPVAALGLWYAVESLMNGYKSSETIIGFVVGAFGLLFVGLGIFCLLFGKKNMGKSPEALLDQWSKDNKYPKSVIQEYINQVLNFDTYILRIAGKFETSGVGTGFLTRDFLAVKWAIMKQSDIVAAVFVNVTENYYAGNKLKSRTVLNIAFVSQNGCWTMAPAIREAAQELVDRLLSKNPNIDTQQGRALSEKEFDRYREELLANYRSMEQ